MAMTIFIDGKEGTTGLRIFERLATRPDLTMLTLPEEKRKDPAARKEAIHASDIAVLCLPDAAAKESVALAEGSKARILDTSTAHRIAPDWSYGFAELSAAHREGIINGSRVAVPGCHASGFVSIVTPLTSAGLLSRDAALSCFSLTGYSGGGKKMIAQYEGEEKSEVMASPAIYGVMQNHKHLPEMKTICSLDTTPVFSPIVDDYYKGMATTVPFHMRELKGVSTLHEVWQKLADYYGTYDGKRMVWVAGDPTDEEGGVSASSKFYGNQMAGKDGLCLFVAGNDQQFTVTALFDNLGKGASGAAVQNMNIMLGLDEKTGLDL